MSEKAKSRPKRASSLGQSVTMSAKRAINLRGVGQCGPEARKNLEASYQRFMSEADPYSKAEAGKDLIRAVFGTEAIAEDSTP